MVDYNGQIAQIPIGSQGLLTDMAPSQIPFDRLTRVVNCDYGLGYIQKAPGALAYNRTALSAGVVALLDYWPTTYKQRLFAATSDGKIWRDTGDRWFSGGNGTVSTAIATGLGTLTNACQFVVGGNEDAGNDKKVFFFSGGLAQIKVCSGDNSAFASISQPAADWPNPTVSSNPQSFFPKFGLMHRNCLWAFAGSTAYKSNSADHEDFVTSNAILVAPVGPGEGGDITGAFVYKQKLFAWKDGDLLYILNDTDDSPANWFFVRFTSGLGISSWHAACGVLDDMIIGNITGKLTSFKATQAYGDFLQADLFKQTRVSKFFSDNTTPMGNKFQQCLYYPDRGIAFFTGRTKGRQNNDCLIQLDVSQPDTPRYGLWTHLSPDCLGLRRDTSNILRPMCGASDGYIYLMDREDRAVSVGYTVQELSLGRPPNAGSIALTYKGNTSALISWNTTAANLQAQLRLLPGLEFVVVDTDTDWTWTTNRAFLVSMYNCGIAPEAIESTTNTLTGAFGDCPYTNVQDFSDLTVAYTGEFRTADLDMRHLDPGIAHKNKLWEWLGVTFQEEGNYTLSVDVWIDGRFRETISFAQTVDTNYAGAFTLGASGSVTGGLDEKTIWKPLHGVGRRITFRCYNAGNNENFKVSMLSVGFKVSGEQATRL